MKRPKVVNQTEPKKRAQLLSPEAELQLIKKKLGHFSSEPQVRYWLDTGEKLLHKVLGAEDKGIPYGKLIEISGFESAGKTALMLELAGKAQKDGAVVGLWDLESSWDPDWATRHGLNPDQVYLFKQEVGLFEGEKEPRLITAQESCEQVELWMKRRYADNPNGRIFLGVDSIAAILTEEEGAAGIQDQNMRTMVSLASFLSKLLRRWTGFAATYNVMPVFVNQLRTAPGAWGNPNYTPGGNAVRFYSSIRAQMYRKGGRILKEGKEVGIRGVISNWKNKAGGGSREGHKVGYKMHFDGRMKYVPAEEIKSDKKET